MDHPEFTAGQQQLFMTCTPTTSRSPSPSRGKNSLALLTSGSASPQKQHTDDAKSSSKKSSRSTSPTVTLALQHNSHDDDTVHFAASSTVSPGPSARTFSPSPLLWSQGGWHAGHFAFALGDEEAHEDKVVAERGADAEQEADARGSDKGSRSGSSSGGGSEEGASGSNNEEEQVTGNATFKEEATPKIQSATIPVADAGAAKSLRSTLTPTAAPFVFNPKTPSFVSTTTTSSSRPRSPHLQPLVTSLPSSVVPSHGTSPSSPEDQYAYASSSKTTIDVSPYGGSQVDYTRHEEESEWILDEEGHLVQLGGADKYHIAEEILQLQSGETAVSTTATMGYGGRVHTKMSSTYLDQGRASESSASSSAWAPPPRPQIAQLPFPSIESPTTCYPVTPPASHPNSPERSRASSLSSQHSYFSPRHPSSYDCSPNAAQLQSYFGPSPVDVNSPYTSCFDHGSLPPSPSATRDFPHHYASSASSSVSSIAYQTDPEDILYNEARETFIQTSFASLSSTPNASNRQAMTDHFDRAMHSPFPLATLYGLTPEAATQLAADPAKSGVADNVLKLALIRGQQQRLAGAAGLGGPSANNRKLGLYKTELCRSWEEKGSCRYGAKCQFAHGQHEVREVARHPKFKSEVCRTFWLHGSCPYGRRCCFIHTTVPGGASVPPPTGGSVAESLAPSSASLTSAAPHSSGLEATSRIGHRMSTTSSAAVAAALAMPTSRGFGPNLSNYVGPVSTPPSLSPSASYHNLRGDLIGGGNVSTYTSSPFEAGGSLVGLGLKAPGKFTTNPSEVPPTYQDPPKSRLERLNSLSGPSAPRSSQATVEFGSQLFGLGNGNVGGSSNYTFAPSSTIPTSTAPHARHSSNSSFSSIGSTSSLGLPRFPYSPFLPRADSNSSLSSLGGGSGYSTFAPLQPVGGDWVGSASASGKASAGVLDWDTAEMDEDEDEDLTFTESTQEYEPVNSGAVHHGQDHYGIEALGSLSLSIDRSSEMTPLGVK